MRKRIEKTRYPGVYKLLDQPGRYRVCGSVKSAKTGEKKELDKYIDAQSPLQASKERAKLLDDLKVEERRPEDRKRLRDYATSWLASRLANLSPSTRADQAGMLDNQILNVPINGSPLGDYYLDAITLDDLVAWRDSQSAQLARGKNSTMRPATVNTRMRLLKQLIRDAVDDEKLARDPTRRLAALREDTDEDGDEAEPKSITAPELRKLLEAVRASPREATRKWYPFFHLLAFSGLRFGEVSALKWSDIEVDPPDPERGGDVTGTIRVKRAQWKGKLKRPKNGKRRSVPLVPEMHEVMQDWRAEQRETMVRRLKRQRVPNIAGVLDELEDSWVFPSRQPGKLMHNTAPRKALHDAIKVAGLDRHFTVHGFRHTFNNLVRQVAEIQGQMVVVRALTGHSSEEMTEQYSHVAIGEKRVAVGGLLRLVYARSS